MRLFYLTPLTLCEIGVVTFCNAHRLWRAGLRAEQMLISPPFLITVFLVWPLLHHHRSSVYYWSNPLSEIKYSPQRFALHPSPPPYPSTAPTSFPLSNKVLLTLLLLLPPSASCGQRLPLFSSELLLFVQMNCGLYCHQINRIFFLFFLFFLMVYVFQKHFTLNENQFYKFDLHKWERAQKWFFCTLMLISVANLEQRAAWNKTS